MNAAERLQPAFYRVAAFLDAPGDSKALGRDRLNRSQNVFHTMMELVHHNALQFLSDLLFSSVNACLRQQAPQVEVLGLEPELIIV